MLKLEIKYDFFKRLSDVVLSLVGILFFAVPIGVLMLVIWIQEPGPVLFRQIRIGRHGKKFVIYKLRTMRQNAPHQCATNSMEDRSKWLLPVGGFLRKTSLDEIPQLMNILVGEMSIVGPRPLILEEEKIHKERLAHHVYSVRPGLTGLAQVNGRDDVTDSEKVRFDVEYVENISFLLDVKIILKTAIMMMNKKASAKVR